MMPPGLRRLLRVLSLRLRSLLRRAQVERELREELGLGPDPAAPAERAGAVALLESCREQRGLAAFDNLLADLRRALRRLRASPGFTLTAVAALAFGVAASTAMFSLYDAVLLAPLPGVAAGRGLVHLERWDRDVLLGDFSYPDFEDYRARTRSFTGLAATGEFELDVAAGGVTSTLTTEAVSADYFPLLGIAAERGRLLAAGDETPAGDHVVVVSDRYWRARMAADPAAVGSAIHANHAALTVIGVAPPGFAGASRQWSADLWVPVSAQPWLLPMGDGPSALVSRNYGWLTVFGRLKSGFSLSAARADVAATAAGIAADHPDYRNRRAQVVAGLGAWSDDGAAQGRFLGLLLGGTLLLVAMTCASLGGMFLARMGARRHELATQLALGANRARLARQFLFEAGWVSAAGAVLGALAALPGATALLRLAPPSVPKNLALRLDARVLAFAAALAILTTLAMALAPALLTARRGQLLPDLHAGRRGATAVRHRAQRALLALQVALALVLLIAAGLAARTLRLATAGAVPPAAAQTALALVDTGHAAYTPAQTASFYRELQSRLAAQPGFERVALTACLAPAPCNRGPVFVAGTEPPRAVVRANEFAGQYPLADTSWVSPQFFTLFATPILQGRNFGPEDRAGAPRVCIINQSLARRLWPNRPAIGQRLAWPAFNWTGDHDFTVVGVVADRRSNSLLAPPPLALYVPASQVVFPRMWIAAQTALPPPAAFAALRRQVAALEPAIPLVPRGTLADQVRRSLWQPLAVAGLAGLFGALAALLTALGLFATIAQLVQERRAELGVRLALGATRARLVRGVLAAATAPLAAGLAAGAFASALSAPLLAPWLFGLTPRDPATWAAAAALLTAVGLAGAALAAARAARLSPLEALRSK